MQEEEEEEEEEERQRERISRRLSWCPADSNSAQAQPHRLRSHRLFDSGVAGGRGSINSSRTAVTGGQWLARQVDTGQVTHCG